MTWVDTALADKGCLPHSHEREKTKIVQTVQRTRILVFQAEKSPHIIGYNYNLYFLRSFGR